MDSVVAQFNCQMYAGAQVHMDNLHIYGSTMNAE